MLAAWGSTKIDGFSLFQSVIGGEAVAKTRAMVCGHQVATDVLATERGRAALPRVRLWLRGVGDIRPTA